MKRKTKRKQLTDGFGIRLKEARKDSGMTQQEVADKIGLTNMAISHFECGRRLPSLENYVRIVRALGLNADYMLGI